jgi:hypothetical protein
MAQRRRVGRGSSVGLWGYCTGDEQVMRAGWCAGGGEVPTSSRSEEEGRTTAAEATEASACGSGGEEETLQR